MNALWKFLRRVVCRLREHDWSAEKSSVHTGYWCNRCRRFLP